MQGGPPQPGMGGMNGMAAMHQQHMQEMQTLLTRMSGMLSQMRANVAVMNPKDQPAMNTDIQLWQLVIDHMQDEMQHMQSMHSGMGEGMGGMQHHHPTPGGSPPPPGNAPPMPPDHQH